MASKRLEGEMSKWRLRKNDKENDQLREGFFALANHVFGLDFVSWYALGFWGEDYTSFSFENEKNVPNISLTHTDFMIQGVPYRALQMGTVMTPRQRAGEKANELCFKGSRGHI